MRSVSFLLVLLVAFAAQAQTPTTAPTPTPRADVKGSLTAGVVPMACMSDDDSDLATMCFYRTDLVGDPLELGCMPSTGPEARHVLELTVNVTPGQNAVLRCMLTDDSGLDSDLSGNALVLDFTSPRSPWVVAGIALVEHVAVNVSALPRYYPPREWPGMQIKTLQLQVE